MMQNSEDFEKKKKQMHEEKAAIDEAIDLKEKAAEKEADNIRFLRDLRNRYRLFEEMYEHVEPDFLNSLPIGHYCNLIAPIEDMRPVGISAVRIRDESRGRLLDASRHYTVLNTAGTTASYAVSGLVSFGGENPQWFPRFGEIIARFKPEDALPNHIEYIKSELPRITPNISKDFDAFVKKFYLTTPNETKYQELIGSRSMFFLKLIYRFTEENFGRQRTRKDDIARFVFGVTPPPDEAEPFIDAAKKLWDELSSQDANESVKTGKVTPVYVEKLFRKIIAVMASLLQLREKFFST